MSGFFKFVISVGAGVIVFLLVVEINSHNVPPIIGGTIPFLIFIIPVIVFVMLDDQSNERDFSATKPSSTIRTPEVASRFSRESYSDEEFQNEIQKQLNEWLNESKRIYWVGDEHRNHPWSLRPGGCTVVVLYENGECRGYDKVKRPHRYLKQVSEDYLSNFESNFRHEYLSSYIKHLYAVREGEVKLHRVWSKPTDRSPWTSLEKYATE